jgi:hypothetical protein
MYRAGKRDARQRAILGGDELEGGDKKDDGEQGEASHKGRFRENSAVFKPGG